VKDFVNHIDYAVKLIGIDHVGISSDFDGGGGIDGWNSAAEAFNVTLELVRRGYTEEQIGKLWSGNLLRVWGEVEKVSLKRCGKSRAETGYRALPAECTTSATRCPYCVAGNAPPWSGECNTAVNHHATRRLPIRI
jgi:Membrane dipeptidase (Peptidase family M19)